MKTTPFVFAAVMFSMYSASPLCSQPKGAVEPISARVYYKDQCLIICQNKEVAEIRFTDASAQKAKYAYHHLTADGKQSEGAGLIQQKIAAKVDPSEKDPFYAKYDRDAMTIKIGSIRLLWRGADEKYGIYYYHPESTSVHMDDPISFDYPKLKRFQKK